MNRFTYLVTTRIWQLATINLTALVLTLLGGVVFGIAPAAAATLHAVHRLDNRTAGHLVRAMSGIYRTEFLRSNIAFVPVCLAACALIWVGSLLGTVGFAVAICIALIVLCFAASVLLVVAHIDANIRDTLHNARMALMLSPYGHLIALLAMGPWLWLIWQQPLVGIYVGLSVPAFIYSGLVLPAVSACFPSQPPNSPNRRP